ncbi:hypothetical protein [Mesorhizobium sp.]|uniref:hypothetical protein n=1 Tax=Mesorhizobium sp. TaxID=1871066 RepID=UPI0025DC0A9E|nr:hypothetical protein [Mesorhizobium sp.]
MRGVHKYRDLLDLGSLAVGNPPHEPTAQHRQLRGTMAIDALVAAQVTRTENQHAFQRRPRAFCSGFAGARQHQPGGGAAVGWRDARTAGQRNVSFRETLKNGPRRNPQLCPRPASRPRQLKKIENRLDGAARRADHSVAVGRTRPAETNEMSKVMNRLAIAPMMDWTVFL